MLYSVVVCEWGCSFCKHVWGDGFIEDDREPSIILYTQLPRIPASLNPAVVRRGVRRPVEPRGDREVYSGDQNRGSHKSRARVEMPVAADVSKEIGRARHRPVVPLA